mmetsp:Transcript_99615/g.277355  ORF Transcript_99615/g.277355 Transcript_99615/m.277355 type:complete len:459 (-) Transcript_99615:89-1465(-)
MDGTVAFWLFIITAVIGWLARPVAKEETTKAFRDYRFNFLLAYGLCVAGSALIVPYGGVLFWSYGFGLAAQIAIVVLAFYACLLFSFQIGAVADFWGRKRVCLLYCAIYMIDCLLSHIKLFWVMVLGTFFTFTAEAILNTTFECWLVTEHAIQRGFSGGLLAHMFSMMFVFRSGIGILSGAVTYLVCAGSKNRELFPGSVVYIGGIHGTFDVAILVLAAAFAVIASRWGESNGSRAGGCCPGHVAYLWEAVKVICSDKRVALLGAVVTCFHGSRNIFLRHFPEALWLQGLASAYFYSLFQMSAMCGVSLGTVLSSKLPATFRSTKLMLGACHLGGALAFAVASATAGQAEAGTVCFWALFVCEFMVGFCWPILGMLKGDVVPEGVRCTLYCLFEFSAFMFSHSQSQRSSQAAFRTCVVALLAGLACIAALGGRPSAADEGQEGDGDVDQFYQRVAKAV